LAADNAHVVMGADESYGEELIDEVCADCGEKLLRSYTGMKWCSKNWNTETKSCKMKDHIRIDC